MFISKKNLIMISAGAEAIYGAILAKKMGLFVIATDGNPEAPAFKYCDDKIIASTYDVDETVSKVMEYHKRIRPVHGVISVAADVPYTTAMVAKELNVFGIPVHSAQLSMNKLEMKKKFFSDNVPVPDFSEVRSGQDLKSIAKKWSFPLVIKPVDSRGARGVLKITPDMNLNDSFQYACNYSPMNKVIVERFLEGPQISTESMIVDGRQYTSGFSDRNYEYLEKYAPHIIENGGDMPSIHKSEVRKKVCEVIELASKSIGVVNGIIKGDIVIHNGVPYVIELATRLSGGYFCTHQIRYSTGVNLVEAAIRQAIGEKTETEQLLAKFSRPVSKRYWFPKPGKVIKIEGVNGLEKNPDVLFYDIRIKIGDIVPVVDSHPARAGVVLATGSSVESAKENAESAINSVSIYTEPQ